MASKQKIIEMLTMIKTVFPKYAENLADEQMPLLVNTWLACLKGYDDNAVIYGFEKHLKTSKFAPTPSEIIEHIREAQRTFEPSNEELWSVFEDTLRNVWDEMSKFNFTFVERDGLTQGQIAKQNVEKIFDNLPPKIKMYVASKGELMNLAKQWACESDFLKWEKQRFLNYMPTAEKRAECSRLIASNETWLLNK